MQPTSVEIAEDVVASDEMRVLASGPSLSYDLQQPMQLDGQHYIQLGLAPADFVASARFRAAKEMPAVPASQGLMSMRDQADDGEGPGSGGDDFDDPTTDPAPGLVAEV